MKVRCKTIVNSVTNQVETTSPWLTVGKEYYVLSIYIRLTKEIVFQLIGDDVSNAPVVFDWKQFDIIDDKLPNNWVVSVDQEFNEIKFTPRKWLRDRFWDDYFNGEQSAIDDFISEVEIIFRD